MTPEELSERFAAEIARMPAAARRDACDRVRHTILAALFDDAATVGEASRCCPRCGSVSFVRKGHAPDGAQRYRCRDCGRAFRDRRGGILRASRLPKSTWAAYTDCFVLRLPLRECARRCGVCLKTAWTMRHRLIACLATHIPAFSVAAGSGCELDETYFRESFKGNHAKGSFEMPRPARRRGGALSKRGLSKEQICVMSGVNDAGGAFLTVCGRGSLSADRALDALRGKVGEGAIVATDRASAYPAALSALGAAAHRAYDPRDRSRGTINRVNSLHSQLKAFMGRFRGVSTKHLQAYLSWFLWERAYGAAGSPAGAAARQMAASAHPARMRDMFNVEPPYMGYWAA